MLTLEKQLNRTDIRVSVVIVCMNNIKNLYPCLNSIKKYTTCTYETLVVAYLFSKENLKIVKLKFPWVKFIESNEIRGFSENNNLGLLQAKGKYSFVLNDDTFFKTSVIDELVDTFKSVDAAIISPNILFPDGSYQCCGRPPMKWYHYVLRLFKLWNENKPSRYINQKGIFQSYNILGAGFMIRTTVFKELGWFDERYFFCPEDIALSTIANKGGHNVFVNSDIKLFHIGGGSRWSNISMATKPASLRGALIFHSDNSTFKWIIISFAQFISNFLNYLFCLLKGCKGDKQAKVKAKVYKNMFLSVFSPKSAKEIFLRYYIRLI